MKLFRCTNCGNPLYFENTQCNRCGAALGYSPRSRSLLALEPIGGVLWKDLASNNHYRLCGNYSQHQVCNWLVAAEDSNPFCLSCRLNRTIPDLSIGHNKNLWQILETDKRRLVYSLLRLGLPVYPKQGNGNLGLAFDFLADQAPVFNERERVMTGHQNGLITLNIAEADPASREATRGDMAEPYRTVLGHFRHESGHYYWDRLIRDSNWLDPFRRLFGNELRDYNQALQQHYSQPPVAGWQQNYVSHYAASHPWEDWAESWAHYLHMVDTLETAHQFNLSLKLDKEGSQPAAASVSFDPYYQTEFDPLIEHWMPLTLALNSLNRSMGHDDAYPFVLAPMVIEKLRFIHQVINSTRQGIPAPDFH